MSALDGWAQNALRAHRATFGQTCGFGGVDYACMAVAGTGGIMGTNHLPADRLVNYCPHCGSDQSQQPCPSCGEILDPLWRFCIACGARVRPLGDHVN